MYQKLTHPQGFDKDKMGITKKKLPYRKKKPGVYIIYRRGRGRRKHLYSTTTK